MFAQLHEGLQFLSKLRYFLNCFVSCLALLSGGKSGLLLEALLYQLASFCPNGSTSGAITWSGTCCSPEWLRASIMIVFIVLNALLLHEETELCNQGLSVPYVAKSIRQVVESMVSSF